MNQESEIKRRRVPGGNIPDEPFPQALSTLAKSRGFDSQSSLARALGIKQSRVSPWYTGKLTPSPDYFGALLRILKPDDQELDSLVEPYCLYLTERSFLLSQERRKKPTNFLGQVIDRICDNHRITTAGWSEQIGMSLGRIRHLRPQNLPSIGFLGEFLDNSLDAVDLSDEERQLLTEGVAQLIESRFREGKTPRDYGPSMYSSLQKKLPHKTYMPVDIAREVGKSRQRIEQLRRKFGIPNVLLTEDNRQTILAYYNGSLPHHGPIC